MSSAARGYKRTVTHLIPPVLKLCPNGGPTSTGAVGAGPSRTRLAGNASYLRLKVRINWGPRVNFLDDDHTVRNAVVVRIPFRALVDLIWT